MSSIPFLVNELTSLVSETRRKHPEVREAAERALTILRNNSDGGVAALATSNHTDDLLRPVLIGCATRNPKVVAISIGSLQRLIALRVVPQSAVPVIVTTLNDCLAQGVDIQLRILQTVLSLITGFESMHGQLLGDALLLCFKLQESKIAVVSSTAAATLRQLVMFVYDKVVDEDKRGGDSPLQNINVADGSTVSLRPSALDAYAVFEDLCLLANSERPHFLRLEALPKTFSLELIESVLTNYHKLFRQHPEILLLLHQYLCPLLLKSLSERPFFPFTLRATRVVFILLKQFSSELVTEAEVFLMLLVKIVSGEHDSNGPRPPWMRVLAVEVIRGLCTDSELMRSFWNRYDALEGGSKVFTSLISALKRLATERPALLGVGHQMQGVGVGDGGHGLEAVAGMVASAATQTVTGALGYTAVEAGLNLAGSSMKLQCIDQLDKADPPVIPDAYVFLLVLQCLVSLSEGFANSVLPIYSSIVLQRHSGDNVVRAPPALDLSALPTAEVTTKVLLTSRDMVEAAWPALLAALSFLIGTNLSEELFTDVLNSLQALTNVAGALNLTTPRDAFLTSLSKFAIPTRVVSKLDSWVDQATPRTPSVLSVDNLAALAGAGPAQPPGLSERNIACLKVFIASALFLAGSLGPSWFNVLEALQNADHVLTTKGTRGAFTTSPIKRRPSAAPVTPTRGNTHASSSESPARAPVFNDMEPDQVLATIHKVFEASRNLEDEAFKQFVTALCKLSAEMIGMQAGPDLTVSPMSGYDSENEDTNGVPVVPSKTDSQLHRRRVSGIQLTRAPRAGDFGVGKLGPISLLNMQRLINYDAEVAWNPIMAHLITVVRHTLAPPSIRLQAAHLLDEVLLAVARNTPPSGKLIAIVQRRIVDALAAQIMLEGGTNTVIDIRKMGLETLHQILQSGAHAFVEGWETIFDMLGSVCKSINNPPLTASSFSTQSQASSPTLSAPPTPRVRPPSLNVYVNDRSMLPLIRVAFQSLTLVCDNLAALSPDQLKLCITTLGLFGRQTDTNIALTAAESLLWAVSDSIQLKRKDAEQERVYSALWMFLLLELLRLCTDARPEVRGGAIQTLFRTLQLYGSTLSLETWEECMWKVIFPVVESITASMRQAAALSSPGTPGDTPSPSSKAWDDSKILALQSLGGIFHDFEVEKILHLESFERVWDKFLGLVQDSFANDNKPISSAALRCLERAVKAFGQAGDPELVQIACEKAWDAWAAMGTLLIENARTPGGRKRPILVFSQECLVAYVDAVKALRTWSRQLRGGEWDLERLTRLAAILKAVLTYPHSKDYRPDVDALTPVQADVIDAFEGVDLSVIGAPSLVLSDFAECITFPFLAAFDFEVLSPDGKARNIKRVSYIGLSKWAMENMAKLYLRYKDLQDIYTDGTLEAILGAYSIPIKLKYDCPAPSKFGSDLPLFKTAASDCLEVIKEAVPRIVGFGEAIEETHLVGLWRQILDVFRGGLLADCTTASDWALGVQDAEEEFDLAYIKVLQADIFPYLGDSRVPDDLISQFGKMLQNASRLHRLDIDRPRSPESIGGRTLVEEHHGKLRGLREFDDLDFMQMVGTTVPMVQLPRERFAYWCFDLLFLICSNSQDGYEAERRRVARICIPSLLDRCRQVLLSFVQDDDLFGDIPFPRTREEELIYVLRQLSELRLWDGTLANTTQDDILSLKELARRGDKAHLFYFYDLLVEVACSPRKPPTAWRIWAEEAGESKLMEVDARRLAKKCLKVLGSEICTVP